MTLLWLSASSDYFQALNLTEADADNITTLTIAAQQFIEKVCHRTFLQQEFDLILTVNQDCSIVLPNPPIDHISHIMQPSGQWATITNTSNTVTQASYGTSATAFYVSASVAGVRTDTSFLFATYTTMSALATAVNALGNGWSMTVASGFANYPTNNLVAGQFATIVNASQSQIFSWEENLLRNMAVGVNNGIIEGYGGVSWAQPWATVWGTGLMRYNPMRVIYTGGFPDVPEPIKMVCANLVISAFQGPEGRVRQETIGAYSYSLWRYDEVPMSDRRVLSYYIDRRI